MPAGVRTKAANLPVYATVARTSQCTISPSIVFGRRTSIAFTGHDCA
jgi:hypothetical protein